MLVGVSAPGVQVQDLLGVSWQLQLGLTDWRQGIHITENSRPDDAQFMVSCGAWYPIGREVSALVARTISDQTEWVDGVTVSVNPSLDSEDGLLFLGFWGSQIRTPVARPPVHVHHLHALRAWHRHGRCAPHQR